MIPGVSRLGITLAVCLAYGFQRKFAVKYAFLLAVPVFIGNFITECVHMGSVSFDWQIWGRICGRRTGSGDHSLFLY